MEKQQIREEVRRSLSEHALTGADFRYIREHCGYSAREFAALSEMKGGMTSIRAVYDMENLHRWGPIKRRYADYLREMVGSKNFDAVLLDKLVSDEVERRKSEEEKKDRRAREQRERVELEAVKQKIRELLVARTEGITIDEFNKLLLSASVDTIKAALRELREGGEVKGSLAAHYLRWTVLPPYKGVYDLYIEH